MTEFASLQDLNSYIEQYEKQHFVQLWKRDARNIETMKKVCPHKLANCNQDLQYYSVTFACSRGGRKFKTKCSGLRNSFTTKNDCPMKIKIKLSPDGQKLQIASLDENHNHDNDKDTFQSLPKQRKLDSEEKNDAEHLLQLKCNKKLLQAYLQNKIIEDYTNTKQLIPNETGEILEEVTTQDTNTETIGENITIIDQAWHVDNDNIRVVEKIQQENIVEMVDLENYTITKQLIPNETGEVIEEVTTQDIDTETIGENITIIDQTRQEDNIRVVEEIQTEDMVTEQSTNGEANLMGAIKLPSVRKRRGRPKGHTLTAIGLKTLGI